MSNLEKKNKKNIPSEFVTKKLNIKLSNLIRILKDVCISGAKFQLSFILICPFDPNTRERLKSIKTDGPTVIIQQVTHVLTANRKRNHRTAT